MAVTLEWVRDNYDTNKNRYIEDSERKVAAYDYIDEKSITQEQYLAVRNASNNHTLLPAYDVEPPPTDGVTLLWVRDHYDENKNRFIDHSEFKEAVKDRYNNRITKDQYFAVKAAYDNRTHLPAYDGEPTPGIDPVTTPDTRSLEEGTYDIVVTKSGYATVYAKIRITSTGNASCISVTGGLCYGTGYPRVIASGKSVKVYMKSGVAVGGICDWITDLGGWKSIQWSSHVLEAYYVYIGASGHSVGFSPVTWNDVLGLYYYYINQSKNDPSTGNAKTGCGFT